MARTPGHRLPLGRPALQPLLFAATLATAVAADGKTPVPEPVDFRRQVVPLLQQRCFACHEGRDAKSGRRLDLRSSLLGEDGSEPLVVPGRSGDSRLIKLVSGGDPERVMPPEGPPLAAEQIALLRRWIDAGLPWDGRVLPDRDDGQAHWAFQSVVRPEVPSADGDCGDHPIDRFIAAGHRQRSLTPAGPADRRTLARRLYLSAWGLPPTWEEVEAFAADRRADAVGRLIDTLLASVYYGEHWARHWLDVARWAESEGFESNHPRPFAWRYRDYVVRAFWQDKPFDEFIRQQLAGDELPDYSDENLIATGYLAAARISSNEEDKHQQRNDVTVDIVNAVGSGLLGLSLHCAQCHDHKFDPLSTEDYYRLHAYFARGMPVNVRLSDPQLVRDYEARRPADYEPLQAQREAILARARQRFTEAARAKLSPEELTALDTPPASRSVDQELLARRASLRFQKTPEGLEKHIAEEDRPRFSELKKRLTQIEKEGPPPPQTFAFYSPLTSPHALQVLPSVGFYPLPYEPEQLAQWRTYVMVRGDVHRIGPAVTPGVPAILDRGAAQPDSWAGTSSASWPTRRELAEWLTRRDHPLLARVWVNRLWHYHFGRGLVATTDDFGVRGARPSHPELLDWLAAELMDHGWSTRHIQRLIMTSRTFARSSQPAEGALDKDPDNVWLTRYAPRRLEAEVLHDALLFVAGELDTTVGGPSVPLAERETSLRRNLYLFQKRGQATDVQRLFDGPNECAAVVGQRHTSTSPLQSLYLLNGPFSVQRSRALASRLGAPGPGGEAALVAAAYRRVLQRDPTAEETAAALRLLQAAAAAAPRVPADKAEAALSPLVLFCQSLLNLNEFAYLE